MDIIRHDDWINDDFFIYRNHYIQEIRMTFGELDAVRERICSQLETEFSEDKKNWKMSIYEGGL